MKDVKPLNSVLAQIECRVNDIEAMVQIIEVLAGDNANDLNDDVAESENTPGEQTPKGYIGISANREYIRNDAILKYVYDIQQILGDMSAIFNAGIKAPMADLPATNGDGESH